MKSIGGDGSLWRNGFVAKNFSSETKMTLASTSNSGSAAAEPLACAVFIVAAFILSGAAHVLWLRSAASMRFSFPIDCGLSLRGKRIFGDHKMSRGFVVIVPATGAAFLMLYVFVRKAATGDSAWSTARASLSSIGLFSCRSRRFHSGNAGRIERRCFRSNIDMDLRDPGGSWNPLDIQRRAICIGGEGENGMSATG